MLEMTFIVRHCEESRVLGMAISPLISYKKLNFTLKLILAKFLSPLKLCSCRLYLLS